MKISNIPYAEIAPRTWCIDEYHLDSIFLLEGDEKALLIDTGSGTFDLPELVKKFTSKPVIVALTHGHFDHCGGINQFPEVYVHPDDIPVIENATLKKTKSFVRVMAIGNGQLFPFSRYKVRETTQKAKLLPLVEGDVIHLGNRDIEVFETPGHTPGGLSFLDRKERIMISGDACNFNTLMAINETNGGCYPKTNISDLLATARKLEELHPAYDRHYNGHVGGVGAEMHFTSMAESLVRDCIELCEGILDGSIKGEPCKDAYLVDKKQPNLVATNRTLRIVYHEDQIR